MIFLAGMGRSGTTWAADIINFDGRFRVLFEPFHPLNVPECDQFKYIQYLAPSHLDSTLERQARQVLSGQVGNRWTDPGTTSIRRDLPVLIKDIRCNLMLGWLHRIAPELKIILLVRHPLQVVDSWKRLGWHSESEGTRGDLDIVLSQRELLEDYPVIAETARNINRKSFMEKIVFLWGIFLYVPLQQLMRDQFFMLCYENLVINPRAETRRLMKFLDQPYDYEKVEPLVYRFSSTNYLNRGTETSLQTLVRGWVSEFNQDEVRKAQEILECLGVANFYDSEGWPTSAKIISEGV